MKIIYLDNASSTKVDEKVLKTIIPYFSEKYANASSKHEAGQKVREAVENSRKIISNSINAKPEEIIFTSGGTESNNLALKGLFFSNYPEKNHLITTKIEHASVLETCKWLEKQGAKITYLDVDKEGFIDLKQLERYITKKTFLVSIIHGNNEIGTIQDLEKIGKICKEKNILFHTDCCQSFTKVPLDVKKQNLDLVSLNSHKIHGPKGIGALNIKEGIKIIPLIHGGGHEFQKRSGTENVPGIIGFAEAVKMSDKRNIIKMKKLQDKLIDGILKIPNTKLNGPRGEKRLCNNINISFKGISGEEICAYLEKEKIYISTGSACQSHESSHVLKALGLTEDEINSSIRISISKYTTEKEIDYFLEEIKKVVERLRKFGEVKKEGLRSMKEFDMAWEEFFKNKPNPESGEEDKKQQEEFYYWYNYVRKQSDTGKTPAEMHEEIYGEDPKNFFDEKKQSRFINFEWDENYEEDLDDEDDSLKKLTELADHMFDKGAWQNSKEQLKEMSKRDSSRHMFRLGFFMHHKYIDEQMKEVTKEMKNMSKEDTEKFIKKLQEERGKDE